MKLLADYHTHTKYSDGKDEIIDNVKVSSEKNLKQIAITDHGFNHKWFPILRKQVPIALRQIENAKTQVTTEVLFGIEANIISRNGDIDVTREDEQNLDVLLLGFHPNVYAKNIKEWLYFFLPNYFARKFGYSKKLVEINTNAYLKAIEKNKIDVLVHLGDKIKVDMLKIARQCKKYGVYLELNGKRNFFESPEFEEIIKTGVTFILNSDAHNKNRVGECEKGFYYVNKYNIPLEQLVNVNKLPTFKNHKSN